jgi:hypothetical protein
MAAVDTAAAQLEAVLAIRTRLLERLRVQRERAGEMWAWYEGVQHVPNVTPGYREAYRYLLGMARTPWARLVVDTVAERLELQGLESGTGDLAAEQAAWRMLQANSIDADQRLVYTAALIAGRAYVSVWPGEAGSPPTITPESPLEVVHEAEPGNRRRVRAALKVYPLIEAAAGHAAPWRLELATPESVYVWETILRDDATELARDAWPAGEPLELIANPLGVVPFVPFENRPTLVGHAGLSEIADLRGILGRIDKLTLDKLLTAEVAAFRQRWATGLEVPRDDAGNPVEPYEAAVKKLWVSNSPDTKFGSFDASDLDQYAKAIDSEIAALAAISRVPAHYLLQQNLANPPSAESLVAAESGLVAKVGERQRQFGESWEQVVRLGFLAAGQDEWAADLAAQVIWADAELRNPAQVADAAVKMQTVGVPQAQLFSYLGYTPTQVRRMQLEAATEALAQAALAPAAPSAAA